MQNRQSIISIFIICFLLVSCDKVGSLFKKEQAIDENDTMLAAVGEKRMYLSELDGMIDAQTAEDSLTQINTFIQAWLKRNVILMEAEDNFPDNVDIDKMVEDYRSSLLLHNYRQKLVENALDTAVTLAEEEEYYNQNKEQYLLASSICRGRIAVVSDKAKRIEKFYRNWQKNDTSAISSYLDENAEMTFENAEFWIPTSQFISYLPEGLLSERDISKKGDPQKHKGDSEYFVKVYDFIAKNEVPPLSYIRQNIRKVIIHKRKKELLGNIEQKLYDTYIQWNKVKVY